MSSFDMAEIARYILTAESPEEQAQMIEAAQEEHREAVQAAIEAERERCAQIAEAESRRRVKQRGKLPPEMDQRDTIQDMRCAAGQLQARVIADFIRKGDDR